MRLRHDPDAKNKLLKNTNIYFDRNDINNKIDTNKHLFLEIGMGKGDFIIKHSLQNPDNIYIGIDKYISVLSKTINKIQGLELSNLFISDMDATFLKDYFKDVYFTTIYLNFNDPWPKARHEKRRLTSDFFLNLYYSLTAEGSTIEFKTDNDKYFEYSIEQFKKFNNKYEIIYITKDLYSEKEKNSNYFINNIPTGYEEKFHSLSKNIYKVVLRRR